MARPQARARFKLVCISLYHEDIARLEALVGELRRRGDARANKSQVVRLALRRLAVSG
jgi:hypothetical protein